MIPARGTLQPDILSEAVKLAALAGASIMGLAYYAMLLAVVLLYQPSLILAVLVAALPLLYVIYRAAQLARKLSRIPMSER